MSKELSTKITPIDQGDLILRKKYPDMEDDTFYSFKLICQAKGLNPHCDQIYAVPRKNYKTGKTAWTFQTSIDGYRLIADRTGNYAPGREPSFTYDKEGKLISATSYLKKRTGDGTWHECAATAFFDEYAQTYKNKEGVEVLTEFWSNMPHGQLAKCSESLNLRRSFPFETADLYTREEMQNTKMSQVLEEVNVDTGQIIQEKKISQSKIDEYYELTKEYPTYRKIMSKKYQIISDLTESQFNSFKIHFDNWKVDRALKNDKRIEEEKIVEEKVENIADEFAMPF